MKILMLLALTAAALVANGCSKREVNPPSPTIHVEPGKFYLRYENRDITDLQKIESVTKAWGLQALDISYAPQSTTSDLLMALSHFGGLGVAEYNLATSAGERFPFFLPGCDCDGVNSIANAPENATFALEKIMSGHSIKVQVYARVMFPSHPVRLADFEECLRQCNSARCVCLDCPDGSWLLYTGRSEDWTNGKTPKAPQPPH